MSAFGCCSYRTAAFVLLAAACCVLSLPPGSSAEACTSGFIGLETLVGVATRTRRNVERQSVYPAINFTCDGSITSWTVLARRFTGNDDTMYPDLQVWRGEGGGAYTSVGNTTLSGGSDNRDDIYEYMLDSPLRFQAGDVFGMFQPQGSVSRLRIHSQRDGGPPSYYVETRSATDTLNETTATVFDDYPIVTVTTEPPECANGFVTLERMRGILTRLNGGRTDLYNAQNIFPNITFTCEANISKWIIGGQTDNEDHGSELQVWRLKPNTSVEYQRVYTSGELDVVSATIADRVFEYPMDPPLTVQPGDVLGIYQPTQSSSRLIIYYEEDVGAETLYQTISTSQDEFPAPAVSVQTHNHIPLVTVELDAVHGSTEGGDSFPAAAVGVGVVVGVLVAVVLATGLVLAVLLLYQNRRVISYKVTNKFGMSNPVYDGSDRDAANDHLSSYHTYEGVNLNRPEEGTKKERATSTDHELDNPLYEAVKAGGNLDETGQRARGLSTEHELDNPLYGDVEFNSSHMSRPHEDSTVSNVYSDVVYVYVPTTEQRERAMTEDIHSTVLNDGIGEASNEAGNSFFAEEEIYWEPALDSSQLYSQLARHKYREIPRSQIRLTSNLGSGQFGMVNRGVWYTHSGYTDVAVKTMKEGSCDDDQVKFLQEAAIMGQFSHPNVVKLYGVVTVGEPVMIVEEFLSKGDLREHLHSLSPVQQQDRRPYHSLATSCLRFCGEIASGMKYLTAKAFVHRDLAARNVLVSRDTVCKIGDFGMTRDIEDLDYYKSSGGKVPVKWTAPEALTMKKYSMASDVWSFGAVMYEIWSLGHKPFESCTNPEAFRKVSEGARLPPPPGCPRTVYQLMINCWHPEPQSRPSFSDVTTFLSQPESALLMWSEEDRAVHPNAATLGAELQEGYTLYTDLQNTYVQTK